MSSIAKYQCPSCDSTHLRIYVEALATLFQKEGQRPTTKILIDATNEWGENSSMQCHSCGYSGKARSFQLGDTEELTLDTSVSPSKLEFHKSNSKA